jgi:hypothetical protein
MSQISRRSFLKTTAATGALAGMGALPAFAQRGEATDLVTLGRSGVKVTRLAFGTGSNNGHTQAALGQQEFTRLVHYAYDRGIRFFETSDSYVTPALLGQALKGLPRESYTLMNKVTTELSVDPQKHFDDMLRASQAEYFDILLLHWQHTPDWVAATANWQEGMLQAQAKKKILAHGASVHGLPALRLMPGNQWLQVALVRMNHNGHVDGRARWGGKQQSGQRGRGGGAREADEEGEHGSDGHEAGGRGGLHAEERPPGGHALRLPERRVGLRHCGLQEHAGDRRGDREPEPGAGLNAPIAIAVHSSGVPGARFSQHASQSRTAIRCSWAD